MCSAPTQLNRPFKLIIANGDYNDKVGLRKREHGVMEYQNFGEFLHSKREEKQVTLRSMAEMLDCSAPFLSDVEKDRRNPPDIDKLMKISNILALSENEQNTMLNLAGKKRNTVAPDLPEYITELDVISHVLRTARELDAGEEDWLFLLEELKKRKSKD